MSDLQKQIVKKPCKGCPFRKDCQSGWLGAKRMQDIISSHKFPCHKTAHNEKVADRVCAGFLLLKKDSSLFAAILRIEGEKYSDYVTGSELVFDTEEECINHHKI